MDKYSPIEYLRQKDESLARVIEMIPEPIFSSTHDVLFDISSCIVGQQIHYRRRTVQFERFKALFPSEYPHPQAILNLDAEAFLKLKLSSEKYYTLQRLSHWWQKNAMIDFDWQAKSDDEIREMLGSIKGIGAWTVEMILLWTLERGNIFPADDYGLKKVMTQIYGLESLSSKKLTARMLEIASAWEPHRSLACRYLWALS